MKKPRTFKNFPKEDVCPICGTNEDAECLLLAIDGTLKDNICEAKPVHLWCAIAEQYNPEVGVIYRRIR